MRHFECLSPSLKKICQKEEGYSGQHSFYSCSSPVDTCVKWERPLIFIGYPTHSQRSFVLNQKLNFLMRGAGATFLATVSWSGTSSYCAMSSVAAPPWHPAPSISNTSVMWFQSWCAKCGFAIRVVRVLLLLVHVQKDLRNTHHLVYFWLSIVSLTYGRISPHFFDLIIV